MKTFSSLKTKYSLFTWRQREFQKHFSEWGNDVGSKSESNLHRFGCWRIHGLMKRNNVELAWMWIEMNISMSFKCKYEHDRPDFIIGYDISTHLFHRCTTACRASCDYSSPFSNITTSIKFTQCYIYFIK